MKVDAGSRRDDGWVDNESTCTAPTPPPACGGPRQIAMRPIRAYRWAAPAIAILNVFSWPPGSQEAGSFLQKFRDAAESNLIPSKPVPLKIADEALWWGDGVAVKSGTVAFGISVHLVERPPEGATDGGDAGREACGAA